MNKDEALKLALEALNEAADHIGCPDDDDAIGIARRAIQEVLASSVVLTTHRKNVWQGLTAKERRELWWATDMSGMPEHDYGKAIEAKLKEKNT